MVYSNNIYQKKKPLSLFTRNHTESHDRGITNHQYSNITVMLMSIQRYLKFVYNSFFKVHESVYFKSNSHEFEGIKNQAGLTVIANHLYNRPIKNMFKASELEEVSDTEECSATIRKFRIVQDKAFMSDFDKVVKKLNNKGNSALLRLFNHD